MGGLFRVLEIFWRMAEAGAGSEDDEVRRRALEYLKLAPGLETGSVIEPVLEEDLIADGSAFGHGPDDLQKLLGKADADLLGFPVTRDGLEIGYPVFSGELAAAPEVSAASAILVDGERSGWLLPGRGHFFLQSVSSASKAVMGTRMVVSPSCSTSHTTRS